jgi:hypothetical protein
MGSIHRNLAAACANGAHPRPRRVSRRGFMAGATGVAAMAATSRLWLPIAARADGGEEIVAPRPIPQLIAPGVPFHIIPTGPDTEPSTITDFEGTIGVAALTGAGVGVTNGSRENLLHVVDVRFMKGKYVGVDGRRHHGTFAFV